MSSEELPSDPVTDQPKTATVVDPPKYYIFPLLPSHLPSPIDSIGHILVPFTHHAFDLLLEDPTLKIAGRSR
ncbi:hypothetical protein N7465_011827 [Penicillium sp. CMV-2018d]|nr:hypothetical protein N7465_011827 [Penicillium sp. CMV-2018d]